MANITFGVPDLMRRAHKLYNLTDSGHQLGVCVAVFSAMAVEAFISDFTLMLGYDPILESIPELLAAKDLMPTLERLPIAVKYELLYYVLTHKRFPKNGKIWSNFTFLFDIRDNFAHFKASVVETSTFHQGGGYTAKHSKRIVTELHNRKLLARPLKHCPYDWTVVLDESLPFAKWSITTAQETIHFVCDQIPKSRFKKMVDSLRDEHSTLMNGKIV